MYNIIMFILICVFMIFYIYVLYRISISKEDPKEEKAEFGILAFVFMSIFVIYLCDRYNIPTAFGADKNVNTQNWLNSIVTFISGILGTAISVFVSVKIAKSQIKEEKNANIELNKESLRVQNMPILKYSIDTKNTELEEKILETNIKDGHLYNFNIYIKNIGLNSIKSIKVDFNMQSMSERILGKDSVETLEKEKEIAINCVLPLKCTDKPYEISVIVHYEDILSNRYKQTIDIEYIAYDVYERNNYIGDAKYRVNEEELEHIEDKKH